MGHLEDAINLIRLPPRYLFAFFAIGLTLIFLPAAYADAFGISSIRERYRPWIGLATICFGAFWVVSLKPVFDSWRREKEEEDLIRQRLRNLSLAERAVLVSMAMSERQTIQAPIDDPVFNGLQQKGLIALASGVGTPGQGWAWSVPDRVWPVLVDMLDELNEVKPHEEEEFERHKSRMGMD